MDVKGNGEIRENDRASSCSLSQRGAVNGGLVIIWADISFTARAELVIVENVDFHDTSFATFV